MTNLLSQQLHIHYQLQKKKKCQFSEVSLKNKWACHILAVNQKMSSFKQDISYMSA